MSAPSPYMARIVLALMLGGVAPGASSDSQNVDVYWTSGVIINDRACVGSQGLHPSDAYDLIADDSADPHCYDGDVPADVSLRTLGHSSITHATLGAHILSAEQPYPYLCDYIVAETVQNPSSELRGSYRYLHARGDSDYWIDIWSGPGLPPTDVTIGSTTDDSNCYGGWTGYHTHQDSGIPTSPYSQPNDPEVLVADHDIPVWDAGYYIHKWTYPAPATPPGTPTITSVQTFSSTWLKVNWSWGSPQGTDVHIERKTGTGGTYSPLNTDTASPYDDSGLSAGTTYCYRMRAHDDASDLFSQSYSAERCGTTVPPPPAAVTLTGANGTATVSWTPTSGASSYQVRVERQNNGNSIILYNYVNDSASPFTFSYSLSDSYHAAVKACNAGGCSDAREGAPYWVWLGLRVNMLILSGPSPLTLSDPAGSYQWVIGNVENPEGVTQQVSVRVAATAPPSGCDKLEQLVFPASLQFSLAAGEEKWVLERFRYECHSPVRAGNYAIRSEMCIRRQGQSSDAHCRAETRVLVIR